MDGAYNRNDAIEIVLNDPSAKPCDLSLDYLRYITNGFSSERELGRGGFGVVYKGVLRNGAMVAVKNLLPTLEFQEKQFKSEIDNLMRVRNENIVRFVGYCYETQYEYIEHNGGHVFAAKPKMLLCFEYMPNGSLCKYISEESHGLDWRERYKIITGICCGLYYLHNECQIDGSVIHLDLKPANILLDDNMVPKIADFGLAKLLDDRKTHACATTFMGSRYYMAPEYIWQGVVSRQADIYSLGVIIIEIITGHRVNPLDNVSSCHDFVELAVQKWRNRLEAAPSETDCKQIKSCLEIGLSCIKVQRNERPTIKQITKMLSTWESTEEMAPASLQEISEDESFLLCTALLLPGNFKLANEH
ncbi:G-type lectin S-receptor-like serine/threonine-protein kinase At1g61370 [Miscanthus floridulus]|uniref:G-type lectin S-receptor-like serine/threonine-protein kinase At1g61370 n=1 Tax=Miscanthus floridulus TaxID=154761 RepID=UPI003459F9CA